MIDTSASGTAPLARWSSRIALFSASLALVGVVLHRLASFPTPVALNLFAVAAAGCVLAVLAALVAGVQIWRHGYTGAGSIAVGLLVPLLVAGVPLAYLPAYLHEPPLNDITTDWVAPPRFAELAKERIDGMNPVSYPADAFPALQQRAYPDLRTLIVDRSSEETYELIEDVIHKLKWKVAVAEAPVARTSKGGRIEATDRTLLVGFTDDIVVRVEGNVRRARVDVRSASRYGRHDFGQNAHRVRRFLTELQTRIESTAPAAIAAGRPTSRATRALVKRLKERDRKRAAARTKQDPAPPGAPRAQAQKERQR